MSEWKTVRLGDVCEIQSGGTPSRSKTEYWKNGTIPWVKIGDFTGKYINKSSEFITEEGLNNSSTKLFSKGTVLYSIFATLGEVAILDIDATTNQAIAGLKIIDNEKLNTDYFYSYLKSLKDEVCRIGRGVAQSNINLSILRDFKIPLPPLDEQKHIAAVLDKCSALIAKHKLMLEKYGTLIKSRFIEMFGDPVQNPMGWEQRQLQDVCNAIVDCPHSTPNYTKENTGFMCIRTNIIRPTGLNWDDIEYISENEFYKRVSRRQPRIGDIVYLREGGILGIAAIINRNVNVALGQRTMLLSPNYEICNSIYVCETMNMKSFFNKALEKMGGSASPHINVADIKAFPISIPPLSLQNDFAAFVQQIDKSKFAVQKSLEKAKILYKSLMQEYFG